MACDRLRVLPVLCPRGLIERVPLGGGSMLVGVLLLCAFVAPPGQRQYLGPRHAEATFTCSVETMYTLDENGALRPSNYAKAAQGDRFVVSGLTGQIIGPWLTTAKATSVQVLREGDDTDWAFEAMARFDTGPNHTVQVIRINRYHPGPRKPFVAAAFSGAGIVTGFCELQE